MKPKNRTYCFSRNGGLLCTALAFKMLNGKGAGSNEGSFIRVIEQTIDN
ncbi:MAG: hypothetical protein L3J45_02605 [Flavobacteriaceae bacterium]|nr:hypothetical protein [Flavobacteriaceae bacterium]